jgi:hypothetical protein
MKTADNHLARRSTRQSQWYLGARGKRDRWVELKTTTTNNETTDRRHACTADPANPAPATLTVTNPQPPRRTITQQAVPPDRHGRVLNAGG